MQRTHNPLSLGSNPSGPTIFLYLSIIHPISTVNTTEETYQSSGGNKMDKVFEHVSGFLGHLMDLGVKLLAVGVLFQILFGAAVPFLGLDVVGAITNFVGALGEKGLVGLVALWVLFWAWNKK